MQLCFWKKKINLKFSTNTQTFDWKWKKHLFHIFSCKTIPITVVPSILGHPVYGALFAIIVYGEGQEPPFSLEKSDVDRECTYVGSEGLTRLLSSENRAEHDMCHYSFVSQTCSLSIQRRNRNGIHWSDKYINLCGGGDRTWRCRHTIDAWHTWWHCMSTANV